VNIEKIFCSKKLLKLWFFALIVKILLASILPMAADENYYWVWSQKLQLSYFDHPGMVAWIFKIGNIFNGLGSAVRIPSVLLSHLTLLVWLQILRPYLDERKMLIWMTLALFSPLLGVGSIIATPDISLLFFWSLSFYAFQKYISKPNYKYAIILGLSLGLGFCSKYPIVLFVPLSLGYIIFAKKWKLLRAVDLGIIFIFGLLGSAPVIIWNFENDFVSFIFQLNHGLGRENWNPSWTLTYIFGQIMLIFPIIFWISLRAIKNTTIPKHWHIFAWGPLLFFALTSFRGVVEANWPLVAYPAIYAIFSLSAPTIKTVRLTVGFWILLLILVGSQLLIPWMPFGDKLNEFSLYKPILSVNKKYRPLYAENYQMASYLWFQTKHPAYKLNKMSRIDHFDWQLGSYPISFPFYVAMNKDAGLPTWVKERGLIVNVVETLDDQFVVCKVDEIR
jgi:4-amino-4-deoxy-L-arabinose transferase-like glycosyltransferase